MDTSTWQNMDYSAIDYSTTGQDFWQNMDYSAVDYTATNGDFWQNMDYTAVDYNNTGTDFWQNMDYSAVDYTATNGDFWKNMDYTAVDYNNTGTDFWQNMDYSSVDYNNTGTDFWQNMDYGSVDTDSMEGAWGMNQWQNYYDYGFEDGVDYSQMDQDDKSRYYTATSGVADMYQNWGNTGWNGTTYGNDYWSDWSSTDNGSYWSDYSYDTDAGYYMGGEGDYFYPTDYGFLKDDMGSFYDMSGNTYEQQKGSQNGMWKDFFANEDGEEFYAYNGNMYEWDTKQNGFKQEFGGMEFVSDYWWTGDYDWDSEYGSWNDWSWEESEYDWGNWEGYDESWLQPMDSGEFEDRMGTFNGTFEEMDPEMDWSYLQKQSDYVVDELLTTVGIRQDEVARYEAAGEESAPLEEAVGTLNEVLGVSQEVLAEMDVLKNLESEDLMQIEAAVSTLDDNSTVAEVEAVEMDVQKLEIYEVMRAMMDVQNEHIDVLGEMTDVVEGMGVVEQYYALAGAEVPSEVDGALGEVNTSMDELIAFRDDLSAQYDEMKALAEEVRMSTDPAFVEEGLVELWALAEEMEGTETEILDVTQTIESDGYMDTMDEYVDNVYMFAQADEMAAQVDSMHEEITAADEVIAILADMSIDDPAMARAVDTLGDLADQGLDVLDQMEEFLGSDAVTEAPELIADLWEVMDGLGYSAETNMDTIVSWYGENTTAFDSLPSEDQTTVEDMMSEWENFHAQEIDYSMLYANYDLEESDEWEDFVWEDQNEYDAARIEMANAYTNLVYDDSIDFDAFVAEIGADQVATIVREVTETIMVDIAAEITEMEGQVGADTLTFALSNANVVGADLMESTMEVYEVIDDINIEEAQDELLHENSDLQPYLVEMEKLYEETQETLISEGTYEEMTEVWGEARILLEVGGTEEEFDAVNTQLGQLLDENTDALIHEEGVMFADVEGDEWYYNYVMSAREDGIVSGLKDSSGELTGEFNPEASITNAEALKMVLEAAGEGSSSGNAGDTSADGQWYEGYVAQAEQMGLSDLGDWNAPCDRGTVAVWVSESFDLGGEDYDYEDAFPDVSGGSDSGHYQAVYEYGIFTGDSATGYLRPEDEINRAEVSKVVNTAVETAGMMNEVTENLEAVQESLDNIVIINGTTFMEANRVESDEVSFFELLKNFFSSVFSF
ncbi:hypothetical protein A2974_01325 [Candidatus Peregrinibacteria bacterium RIFCSPLOWO2_01_FULL_48_20]|nr:MAG: hypothetical protein A2974_01325 [Candidatus Peregrinibacteria bacterium RIFCSPLOWO2_01_FULL_48_20]